MSKLTSNWSRCAVAVALLLTLLGVVWIRSAVGSIQASLLPNGSAHEVLDARLRASVVSVQQRACLTRIDRAQDPHSLERALTELDAVLTPAIAAGARWISLDLLPPAAVSPLAGYREFLEFLESQGSAAGDLLQAAYAGAGSERLRALFVMAMGDLRQLDSIPLVASVLASTFRSHSRVLHEAGCYSLARMRHPDALAQLEACLVRFAPDWQWSLHVHEAAGSYGRAALPILREEFVRLSRDGQGLAAHLVLGALRVDAVDPELLALALQSEQPRLQAMAIHALAAVPGEESLAIIQELLDSAPTRAVAAACLQGLHQRRDAAVSSYLRDWIEAQTRAELIGLALNTLAGDEDERTLDCWLRISARHASWTGSARELSMAWRALLARLSSSRQGRAQDQLLALYASSSAETRRLIVEVLGQPRRELPAGWSATLLQRLESGECLTAEDFGRTVAALCRSRCEASAIIEPVFLALAHSGEAARRQALACLNGFARTELERGLLPILRESDVMTRIMGAEAIQAGTGPTAETAALARFERDTLNSVVEDLDAARISRYLLANPDTQILHAIALRGFLGRVGTPEHLPHLEQLAFKYRAHGKLAHVLEVARAQIEARHATHS